MVLTLAVGSLSGNKKEAAIHGALFGYILFLSYVFIGYTGKTDPVYLMKIVIFSLLFSFVGSLFGAVGAYLGFVVIRFFQKSK
jgi:hypothetical protein